MTARILHVCDAYEAITAGRTFQEARIDAEAREEIRRCAGTQFDPKVVDAFVRIPAAEWEATGRITRVTPASVPRLEELKASFLPPNEPRPESASETAAKADAA
jgi:hypothetical protein